MEYVKKNNGTTIFAYYDEESKDMKVIKEKEVVSFFTKADFSSNSSFSSFVEKICNIKDLHS